MAHGMCASCGKKTPDHYKRAIHKKNCPRYTPPVWLGRTIKRVCQRCQKEYRSSKHFTCWECRGKVEKACKQCGKYFHGKNRDICLQCLATTTGMKCERCDKPLFEKRERREICTACLHWERNEEREPTEKELAIIIAEQYQCLPDWFYADHERLNGPESLAALPPRQACKQEDGQVMG